MCVSALGGIGHRAPLPELAQRGTISWVLDRAGCSVAVLEDENIENFGEHPKFEDIFLSSNAPET